MRNFLIKILERWQQRLYNQKDDLRDWEWIKKEVDKHFEIKSKEDEH